MFELIGALGSAAIGGGADFGSAMLSQYYNKKNMRDQARLQYEYAQRYALNSPSWNIQGLRAAGLNPMLAVSNGVNLGANIPNITNSSPKADIDVPALEALRASNDMDVSRKNAESNATTAESQSTSAAADMLRAKSDAALKQAEAAKVIQDTNFEKEGGGFKNPLVNDLVRAANKGFDSVEKYQESLRQPTPSGDVPQSNSYLDHGPAPRDFRDTLSDSDRKLFNELEQKHGKGTATEFIPRIREKHDTWRFNRSRSHSSIYTR